MLFFETRLISNGRTRQGTGRASPLDRPPIDRRSFARRARRRAFTLVELLTALAIFSAVFGAVLASLHAFQKISRQVNRQVEMVMQQQQFVAQLRRDGHQARGASLASPDDGSTSGELLQLDLANQQRIEYQIDGDMIHRRLVSDGETVHRESYIAYPVAVSPWSLDTSRDRPRLSIHLSHLADNSVPSATHQSRRVVVTLLLSESTAPESQGASKP